MNKIILYITVVAFASCKYSPPKVKFTKALWEEKEDWDYPKRDLILDDFLHNHKLTGLTYRQLTDSLGTPANFSNLDSNTVAYEVLTDFGSNIDPVHTKTLIVKFDTDSTITGFEVKEWNKKD